MATNLRTNLTQLLRGSVAHHTLVVDDASNVGHNVPQRLDWLGKGCEGGVAFLVATMEKLHKVARCNQRLAQLYHLGNLQECALDLRLVDNLGYVVELLGRCVALGDENLSHLLGEGVTMLNLAA